MTIENRNMRTWKREKKEEKSCRAGIQNGKKGRNIQNGVYPVCNIEEAAEISRNGEKINTLGGRGSVKRGKRKRETSRNHGLFTYC